MGMADGHGAAMADGTEPTAAGVALPDGLPSYELRGHLADPAIWREWLATWVAWRSCAPSSVSRSARLAGGPLPDAAAMERRFRCEEKDAAWHACEQSALSRVKEADQLERKGIAVYGRRGNTAANPERIKHQSARYLDPKKKFHEKYWAGGGLIFYDLQCCDTEGVPPEQAAFAYGPDDARKALDSLPSHSNRPAPLPSWSPGVMVTYAAMQPNGLAPFKDEAAAYLALRSGLLDAVRTGRLLVSHLGKDGRRSDLSPTQAGRLQSWAMLEAGLRFPLVRPKTIPEPVAIKKSVPSRVGVGGPQTTKYDWIGMIAHVTNFLRSNKKNLRWLDTRGNQAKLELLGIDYLASKGSFGLDQNNVRPKVKEAMAIYKAENGWRRDG